ncbi:MAG: hypothetical protein RL095_1079 [Verrucomicrobiota bacterium]|jgi:alpha-L-fucosidase
MRTFLLGLGLASFSSCASSPSAAPLISSASSQAEKDAASVQRRAWFEDARFGLFMHWGLYSALEGSWKDRTLPDPSLPHGKSWYAEWIQKRLEIPDAEYRALAKGFNPVHFEAEALVLEAKRAGMKYIALTAKHHDGFALWDSAVSDFDLGATPCKRDLLDELAHACRTHGIKLGFYYSHWMDWEHPGGVRPDWPDSRQPDEAQFESYWKGKALPQISELIARYDPDLFWFDTWGTEGGQITPKRRDELIDLIRRESPKCLINGRICFHDPGNDVDFLEMGDNQYPKTWPGKPWQSPATMQHSWGYHAKDFAWKPSGEMIRLLSQCSSLGGNYLLNIGPKADGSIPAPATRRLREIGGWMAANAPSIQNTSRLGAAPWGWWTASKDGSRLYAHVHRWPADGLLPLGELEDEFRSARILETGMSLELLQRQNERFLAIPQAAPDPWNTVIELTRQ